MGQTLTNGLYLPDEGERNCYSGLESNWRALDAVIGGYNTHIANLDIHVTAADKNAWNGHVENGDIHVTAADKTGWNNHVGNSDIHVTAADKTNWNGKADDTDVVHKSGTEIVAGLKTFSDLMSIDGDYLGNEASTNQRTNLQLRSNRDTAGMSSAYITRFRQNRSQGGMQTNDVQKIGFDVLENEVRTNNIFDIQATGWSGNVPTKVKLVSSISDYSFGSSYSPCKINELDTGELSLPNLSAGVDISSYITLGTYHQDTYTPPSDGYISIMIYGSSASGVFVYSGSFGTGMRSIGGHPTYGQVCVIFLPVRAGTTYTIENTGATNIGWAYFYPCQGNV